MYPYFSGNDRHIIYSLTSNPNGVFRIDGQSGLLQLSKTLDRETTPSYTITIQAVDKVRVICLDQLNDSPTEHL